MEQLDWLCIIQSLFFASKTRAYERKQTVMLVWWDFNGVKFSCGAPEVKVEYRRLGQASEDWFIALKPAAWPVSPPAVQEQLSATSLHKSHPKLGAAVFKCAHTPPHTPGSLTHITPIQRHPVQHSRKHLLTGRKFHTVSQENVIIIWFWPPQVSSWFGLLYQSKEDLLCPFQSHDLVFGLN